MRRVLAFGSAAIIFLLLLGTSVAPANAHAQLLAIDPADGSSHPTMPGKAKLEFDDPIESAAVVLTTSANEVGKLAVVIEGTRVVAKLPSGGPRGPYRLAYRVVSSDGHVVTGTVQFTIVEGAEPRGDEQSVPSKAVEVPRMPIIVGAVVLLLIGGGLVFARARR